MEDLREALVWIKRNVESYGGDLEKVYLMVCLAHLLHLIARAHGGDDSYRDLVQEL